MNSVRECCRWLSVAVLFGCVSPPETLNQERLGKERTECIRAARMAALMKASQRDAQSKTLVVDLAKMRPDNRSSDPLAAGDL